VREGATGGSSTLPQKRNPVRSTHARACAELVGGYASVLSRSIVQEHERAAGAWHAEWTALTGALAFTGGAASAIAEALDGLEVDGERMRRNLELTDGLIVAERVAFLLAGRPGGEDAHEIVRAAALRAADSGRTFQDELKADERVGLSDQELAAALDPSTYLGSAEAFVDRALEDYRLSHREVA
jgi:3-carboxy-cis,cis-muconate cycloisomerase